VSNPPYVAESEVDAVPPELRHEPRDSLVSGPTGLEVVEVIVREAPAWLDPVGTLVCEIAPHQAEPARRIATAAGFDEVLIRQDLTGRDRVLVARKLAEGSG
jgi:release factor glutamine methyltransferase